MAKKKEITPPIDVVSIEVENIECQDDNIELTGKNTPYSITMYLDKNVDDTYFKKFVKATEKVVRSNKDYSNYLKYLREEEGLTNCVILHNVSSAGAMIELHHFPFTLYTITAAIANKMLLADEQVSTFYLADKVIQMHFNDKIGIVPLSTTIHELAHLDKIQILKKHVYGNYNEFYEEYKAFLSDRDHQLVKNLETITKLTNESDIFKQLEHTGN